MYRFERAFPLHFEPLEGKPNSASDNDLHQVGMTALRLNAKPNLCSNMWRRHSNWGTWRFCCDWKRQDGQAYDACGIRVATWAVGKFVTPRCTGPRRTNVDFRSRAARGSGLLVQRPWPSALGLAQPQAHLAQPPTTRHALTSPAAKSKPYWLFCVSRDRITT